VGQVSTCDHTDRPPLIVDNWQTVDLVFGKKRGDCADGRP